MNRSISKFSRKVLAIFLALNIVSMGLPGLASAGNIGTEVFLNSEGAEIQSAAPGSRIEALMARDAVSEQMVAMGVDQALVAERLAALSDAELQALENRLDELPAGGSVLGIIGTVVVVLLVLELLGVTDVFTRI